MKIVRVSWSDEKGLVRDHHFATKREALAFIASLNVKEIRRLDGAYSVTVEPKHRARSSR